MDDGLGWGCLGGVYEVCALFNSNRSIVINREY